MCLRTGRGGEDVGISNQRGARCKSPVSRTRGVREVSATCNLWLTEIDFALICFDIVFESVWCLNANAGLPVLQELGPCGDRAVCFSIREDEIA
jgi:hypothetical protein